VRFLRPSKSSAQLDPGSLVLVFKLRGDETVAFSGELQKIKCHQSDVMQAIEVI